jgi:uracil-DNA glycosylase
MPKLVLVGEAWGEHEALYEHPFVGAAGQELFRMLTQAGFSGEPLPYRYISPLTMRQRWSLFSYPLLNVFNARPADNNIELFYGKPRDAAPLDKTLPPRRFGMSTHFVLEQHAFHVHALHAALRANPPNLIVALGATACWALGLGTGISKLRGFVHESAFGKVLPVYHPAAILRNWSLRGVTVLDLFKARREMQFAGFRLIEREIWTEPSVEDLWTWWEQHGERSSLLSFDIETLRKQQISEIAFASDSQHALHIPFCWQEGRVYRQWWPDARTELQAWKFVKHVCESDVPKIGQNGIQYDCFWLAKELGITVRNVLEDSMTKAHCWQPELEKSLGFLGSVFLDDKSWKSIRRETMKEKDND